MAAQPGSNKKATIAIAVFIAAQVIVAALVWVAFSGSDEREGRIKATLALGKAGDLENAIAAYYGEHKALPADNNALRRANKQGTPYFTAFEERGELSYTVNVANGIITLTFSPDQKPVSGKSLVLVPRLSDGKLEWSCNAGSLEASRRPSQCRGE
ncbi:MAG: pilin [Nitrosomonadales bacterium]|nr:pilin [Nitrosomonadales bacterium]